ncbi:MAG: UDP-2,3-diacylglucosamine hydrolase [Chitinophagaceae bacterium]|nr:MAG: UDP-2,3-diacylglucosamine hydrolase [Chitinophagaceae bacterium]
MQIPAEKKIYFLSDFHLGVPNHAQSLIREKKIVSFLEEISNDAAEIFIVGDLFDFWFEYRSVVPKGYVRILGKIAELTDRGIPIHFFTGNHDMWMSGYFEKELNVQVYQNPKVFSYNSKKFYIGHGDGLGPGDYGYKFIKRIFRNPICNFLFGLIPPHIGIGLANYFSKTSRASTGGSEEKFLGEQGEWLICYCKDILKEGAFDYFIFGHRHFPIDFNLSAESKYINLGDWIKYDSYAVFDGFELTLKQNFHA